MLAEGAQEEKTEESGPAPLQPFPVREHSANVFALLVRFLHIRQVAFGIWREELVDHFPALVEDGTDDPRVTLERATGRVFQDDTFECDHAKPYAPAAQQQNIFGDVVADIDQLYEAAGLAKHSFVAFMASALSQVDTVDFEAHKHHWIAPLKSQTRAAAKAQNDYATRSPGPAEAWLYDIVRGKVVCESIVEILDVMRAIKQTIERAAEIAGCGRLLRVKNRCIHPPLSGCRDIMINIQLPVPRPDAAGTFFTHVCEIQIHHRRMKEHDDAENSHKVYEFFRDFFAGGERDTVEARMAALEAFGERLDAIGRSAGGAAGGEGGGGGGAAGGGEGGIADLGMLVAWVGRNETDVGVLQALEEILRNELSEPAAATHVSERLVALSGGADSLAHAAALFRMAESARAQGDSGRALALAGGGPAHRQGSARRRRMRRIQAWPSPSTPWPR